MALEVKEISSASFGRCVELNNGHIYTQVTIEKGPRVLSFGFCGKESLFYTEEAERSGPDELLREYEGHRMALAVGEDELEYSENEPVVYHPSSSGVTFQPPCRKETGLQFTMEILMDETLADMMVVHSVKNTSKEKICTAIEAVTSVKTGGIEVLPQNPLTAENPALPNQIYAFWPGSTIQDPRLAFGEEYITVGSETGVPHSLSFGINNKSGWMAYVLGDTVFVKRYVHNLEACYPNHNCSCRTTAADAFLQMETYSPLYWIEPGETIRHVENFSVFLSSQFLTDRTDPSIKQFLSALR